MDWWLKAIRPAACSPPAAAASKVDNINTEDSDAMPR